MKKTENIKNFSEASAKATESIFVDKELQKNYSLDFSNTTDSKPATTWFNKGIKQGWIKVQNKTAPISLDKMLLSSKTFEASLNSLFLENKRSFTFLLFDNCQTEGEVQEKLLEQLFINPLTKDFVGKISHSQIAAVMLGTGRFEATAFAKRVTSSIQAVCTVKAIQSSLCAAIVDSREVEKSSDFYINAKLAMQGKCSTNSTDSVFIFLGDTPENKSRVQADEKRFLFFGI